MKVINYLLLVLFVILCLTTQGFAQKKSAAGMEKVEEALPLTEIVEPAAEKEAAKEAHHGKSADEIAKELVNPNNDLAKLTFKNQFRWYTGDLPDADDQWNYTLLFQPVFPFTLGTSESGSKSVLFVRPAFPFLFNQPVPTASNGLFDWDGVTALGDIVTDLAYAETTKSGFVYAAGMVSTLPTATDNDVAGKQLRLGPEALLGKLSKWGLIAIFPSHQWNVTGWSDNYYSTSQCQFFLTFTPGGGWAIGTQPTMNYDWRSNEWTIPLHLTVSKTVILGKTPLKLELELNYYVEQPDAFGPQWLVSFNLTPIVSNFIANWIRGK